MRGPGRSVFLFAILLGLATGDLVVAEEPEPKLTDKAILAVQTEQLLPAPVLEWYGEPKP